MSKVIGITVGTPISKEKIKEICGEVKTVNGVKPDDNGDVKITIPEQVTIDNSLTVEGAAAESKATGDRFTELENKIENLENNTGGSGGGGADWNANEGEAGYVKNRTHYGDYYKCNKSFALPVQSEATVVTVEGFKYKFGDLISWGYYIPVDGETTKMMSGTLRIPHVGKQLYIFGDPKFEVLVMLEETGENGVYNLVFTLTNKYSEEEKFVIDYEYDTLKRLDMKYLPEHLPYESQEIVNEPLNLTWDGNTEGLVCVGDMAYKVSDLVLTDEQIHSVTLTFDNGSSVSAVDVFEKVSDEISVVGGIESTAIFVKSDNAVEGEIVFPKAGIYFGKTDRGYIASLTTTESIEHTKTVVKKLDKKYLPDDVGGLFKVNVYYDEANSMWVSDKTYDEIRAAEQAKMPIVGTFTDRDGKVFTLVGCDVSAGQCFLSAFDVNVLDEPYIYRINIVEGDDLYIYRLALTATATELT